ncbi:MAG: hypothetical protein ACPHCN_16830 [Mycobacterium sp.]
MRRPLFLPSDLVSPLPPPLLRPNPRWARFAGRPIPGTVAMAYYTLRVGRAQLVALSALEIAVYPRAADGSGPQWHVSVSSRDRKGERRVTDKLLNRTRVDFFGPLAAIAEEDNHEPGMARHLWLPVDPACRVDCECNELEVTVDTDGHLWSNPIEGMHDPARCRGCALHRITGRDCPLHSAR